MAGPRLNTTESAVTTNHASHPYLIAPRVTSLIDGVAVSAQLPGHDIEIINPTTEQQISTLREADAAEVIPQCRQPVTPSTAVLGHGSTSTPAKTSCIRSGTIFGATQRS